MRFERTNTYPAAPDAVLAMLLDPAFREAVCAEQNAVEHTVKVSGSTLPATVSIRQRQSMADAPSVARKLTGDHVEVLQEETWESATHGTFAMQIPGKPGHLRGEITLTANPDGTTAEHFVGQVTVNVPLVRGKLEDLIGRILGSALKREGRVGVRWLEERR